MHFTLTPKANLRFIALWAVACAVALAAQANLEVLVGFALMGLVSGRLQSRAIRQTSGQLRQAASSREVRDALTSVACGKLAVALLWAAGSGLLLLIFFDKPSATVLTLMAGFFAFCLTRDLSALTAILSLSDPK